ncbi:MAG: FAD-binding oxidoreductase, partial [Acidobacteria bacterium]|nr:FAD-binding oxidoreductase [Acidobacteriota bacterium]
ITAVNPEKLEQTGKCEIWLKERLRIAAPKIAEIKYRKFWAELRTFTFDNNFLIGFDPLITNLFWATALQGYGITCSAGVGETVSDLICGKKTEIDLTPHSPARFK